jgi:hypothetical protein
MAEKKIAVKDKGPLEELAHAVAADKEARILEMDGAELAAVVPIEEWRRMRRRHNPTDEDVQRSLSSAGSWKGLVDEDLADQVMKWRHEQPLRPPVEW